MNEGTMNERWTKDKQKTNKRWTTIQWTNKQQWTNEQTMNDKQYRGTNDDEQTMMNEQ